MKTLLLFLSCVALAASTFAQTSGQFELRRYNTGGGMTSFWITPENSKAFGLNGSGVPAMIAVGGSSTLAGLSDVAISGGADLDLLQYNAGTGKYSNIPGSTYALAAHNQEWSTITSTPTTLAGYNVVNPDIGAATATSINGAGIFSSLGVIGVGASSTAANRVAGMSGNIAIGASALGAAASTTFDENTAIGKNAIAAMTSSSTGGNTAIGSQSMEAMTGGSANTAIGYESMGQTTANISGVIAIGNAAGRNATASNELFINSQVKSSYASDQTQSIIYGGMAAAAASQFLHFNVGYLQLGNSSTASELRFMEPSGSGTNYTGFRAPALAGDVMYTMPAADGTSGQVLMTNGSGQLSFATVSPGITIGTTTSNGTAGHVLYTDGANVQAYATTGTGDVVRGTSPTFFDKVTVSKTGTSTIGGLEVLADPLNPGVDALHILPPVNSARLYIGKAGQSVGAINYQGAGNENFGNIISVSGHYQIIEYGGTGISLLPFNGPVNLAPAVASGVKVADTFIEVNEMTEPAAPASNKARFFLEDNGSGKSRLMVRFPSGASQQIAIEP